MFVPPAAWHLLQLNLCKRAGLPALSVQVGVRSWQLFRFSLKNIHILGLMNTLPKNHSREIAWSARERPSLPVKDHLYPWKMREVGGPLVQFFYSCFSVFLHWPSLSLLDDTALVNELQEKPVTKESCCMFFCILLQIRHIAVWNFNMLDVWSEIWSHFGFRCDTLTP